MSTHRDATLIEFAETSEGESGRSIRDVFGTFASDVVLEPQMVGRPLWARDYDDPVVVAPKKAASYHEPDLNAPDPRPRCRYGGRDDTDWVVREREFEAGWTDDCDWCRPAGGGADVE